MESPDRAALCFAEGVRLSSAGRFALALTAFEEAARSCPENAEYQVQLGLSYQQVGRARDAALAYGKAVELAPDSFHAWNNLAATFTLLGDYENAVRAGQRAVKLQPREPVACVNLYRALAAKGDLAQAQWVFNKALALHLNIAQALGKKRRFPAAWEQLNAALSLAPDYPYSHFCAGVICLRENRLEAAAARFQRAIELRQDRPEFWTHLAQVHLRCRSLSQAGVCLTKALALDPNCSDGRYLQGWLDLSQGHLKEGWPKLEPRWISSGPRDAQRPIWEGEPLDGRTILLYLNHGFGDTLHFVRYAPLVAAREGKVVLECNCALESLLRGTPAIDSVVGHGQPLPPFDVQASLLSLPRIFGTTLKQIPNQVPYIRVPASSVVPLPSIHGSRLKVGLVWGGSELLIFDQVRSLPLAKLAPLFSLSQVAFYSLQIGPPSRQLQEVETAGNIVDLGPQLTDFAATASAIGQMDLVITVDTSVAHLAGALGKPVWVLLLFFADWRWMYDRDDSPWYPSMRLFRQKHFNDGWDEVVLRVREALARCLTAGGQSDGVSRGLS